MSPRSRLWSSSLLLFVSCAAAPADPVGGPSKPPASSGAEAQGQAPKVDTKAADEQKQKADAKKQKQKELRQKQRELDYARAELLTAELDRRARTMGVEAALVKTAGALEQARADLAAFTAELKPRELEEKRISLERSAHRADHAKDELGELTAMYEADEFARTTKELVLKRGRRELEMAERSLGVERKELAFFEQQELPRRERELRQKIADAELDRAKAEIDAEKARAELELQARKAKERIVDLEQDVADLQEALAKESA